MRTRNTPRILALSVLFLAVGAPGTQALQLTPEETTAIQAQASDVVETYYRLFSERTPEQLPERIFSIPWFQLGANGIRPTLTATEAEDGFRSSMTQLIGNDWQRSVFTITNVCVLNANVAIVSGFNTRYRTSGEVMSVGGVSYLLGRSGDRWLISSYFGHPQEKVVRCD
jgi:hypothetical protein